MMRLLSPTVRCVRRVDGVVLAQRMPLPVLPEENAAMIRMSLEAHSEHVPTLALHPVGAPPDAGERGTPVDAGREAGAERDREARIEVLDTTDDLHPLLLPVDGGEKAEVVAAERRAREACGRLPLLGPDRERHDGTIDDRLDGELLAETRCGVGGGQRRHFVSAAAERRSPVFWKCATCS